MRCEDTINGLAEYWDLSADDDKRRAIDAHIANCVCCQEEFLLWQESAALIQRSRGDQLELVERKPIAAGVMERIYSAEAWRLPVSGKSYALHKQLRFKLLAALAACLAVFTATLIYAFTNDGTMTSAPADYTGIVDTVHHTGELAGNRLVFDGIQVASISAPTVLRMGPLQTYTDFLLALSILGVVSMLLIMNWISRLRT